MLRNLLSLLLLIVVCNGGLAQLRSSVNWKARWIEAANADAAMRAAQCFQKNFETGKKIKSATLYITSRGLYEAHINGMRVGDAYLTPGWTSYRKRLQYQQYDVTTMLKKGGNTIDVTIGDGWYRGHIGFDGQKNYYGDKTALLCQLEIIYSNNERTVIISDGSWKAAQTPVLSSDLYNGETIDARVHLQNWTSVKEAAYGFDNLIPTENEPIRKHETFKPVKILTTPKGEKVIDFGQNLSGWVIVKASGHAGSTITIQHAEVLDKEGNFYTANLRSAKATATYILAGEGEETFEPHFTFYGFRYIKVEGYPGELKPENFTAVALYSDMEPTGTFECSNSLLNQLQHNIQWGQRGNFLDVPTDCPQRDERLGWTGDAQAFFRTAAYNFNVNDFFRKWMKDVEADQLANGVITSVVPDVLNGFGGSSGWADVATIIPWQQYEIYGDAATLAAQYSMMKKWVDYIQLQSKNDLWQSGFHFGDWLSYRPGNDDGTEAVTDKFLIAQCFWAHSTQNLINAAKVLGKADDVRSYEAMLSRIKAAFMKEYVTPNGRLMSNTQTAYVLALHFDMLPEDRRAVAAGFLADNIKLYRNHLTTGFLGTPYLCHVLSRFGYNDVAYTLLVQETFPSWLYPVKMGATTIWERWDGIKPDGSFQTPVMNSFNHYAYGAIGDWMYRNIAGIQSLEPGYKKIRIQPLPGGGLTWAKGSYKCGYGTIVSEWHIQNNKLTLTVEIPAGTNAEVYVPTADGKLLEKKDVGPGRYTFGE